MNLCFQPILSGKLIMRYANGRRPPLSTAYSIRLVAAVTLFAYVEASALESQPVPTLPETSGHTSDQTFPQNGATTDEEERMFGPHACRGLRRIHSLDPMRNSLAKRYQQWMKKLEEKSAREAFTFFELHEAGDDVFRSDNFRHWESLVSRVHRKYSFEIMVEVLLYHFGNFRLAEMLDAAKKGYNTNPIAIALEDTFISRWQHSNLGITFDKLGFEVDYNYLLRDFLFKIWYKFAKKKEGSPEQVVKIFAERLNELHLIQKLDVAKRDDRMKEIAIELEGAYISLCQRSQPGIEFHELGFEAKSNGLLRNPLFEKWYNLAKKEWSPIKVMGFLRARFGDFDFAKMLDAAKKAASTNAIAIELEDAYISLWQGIEPRIIFNEVGLDAKSNGLLGIPLFKTWYKFARKEKWPPTQVMEFLKGESDGISLAVMLDAASKAEDTEAIAIELLKALFKHWSRIELIGGEKMRPTRPISLLRKTELGQIVSADDFSVWRKYTEWRRKKGIPE